MMAVATSSKAGMQMSRFPGKPTKPTDLVFFLYILKPHGRQQYLGAMRMDRFLIHRLVDGVYENGVNLCSGSPSSEPSSTEPILYSIISLRAISKAVLASFSLGELERARHFLIFSHAASLSMRLPSQHAYLYHFTSRSPVRMGNPAESAASTRRRWHAGICNPRHPPLSNLASVTVITSDGICRSMKEGSNPMGDIDEVLILAGRSSSVDGEPGDWRELFDSGRSLIADGRCEEACARWIDAFETMPEAEFDGCFHIAADLLEDHIVKALWRSVDEVDIAGVDDLAYSIFMCFPEKRCEDTDLLVVLLKRLNPHMEDINHVGYLVDLVDEAEILARKHIDMNVEIRTHRYVSDIVLGICSAAIMRSAPMLESSNDRDEVVRTVSIIGEVSSMFSKMRDSIARVVDAIPSDDVDRVVRGWSGRCTSPYMDHLERAFDLSMRACCESGDECERLRDQRDSEVEKYVETYFRGHRSSSMNAFSGSPSSRHSNR